MQKKLELIVTKDGSHSLYNSELQETYHSVGGAIEESKYIYINEGLKIVSSKLNSIKILEVGLGTGLNAILTLKEAEDSKLNIYYATLEPYPLTNEITGNLNYPDLLPEYLKENFLKLHSSSWEKNIQLTPHFHFTKKQTRLEEFETDEKFDLVYFDAFAPSKQADIWNINNLKKVRSMMNQGGTLVTYCSRGQFKRDLKEVGFTVESLPGPLGKREMTRARAVAISNQLSAL